MMSNEHVSAVSIKGAVNVEIIIGFQCGYDQLANKGNRLLAQMKYF